MLLVWELGAGFGHSTKLARLGARLRAAGCEVVAALPHVHLAAPLVQAGIEVLEGPRLEQPAPPARRASTTLTDSLAQAGLMDEAGMARALGAWRSLMDAARPDLMVLDYAPLATLAARGRTRTIQTGVGYCQPPAHLATFPRLHDLGPPGVADEEMRARINGALAAQEMAPITRMGELFDGDDTFVTTFQLLDPYADLREREADGPLLDRPPHPKGPDARGIFAYLHADVVAIDHVRAGLAALGPQLEIYVPGAPEALVAPLHAAGARVRAGPQPMAAVLERSRLLLHQGSAGVAADALAAGVPQFTLCWHVEHHLNGEALAAAGVGRARRLFDPAFRLDAGEILAFAQNGEAAFMAEAAGRIHRDLLSTADPLATLTRRCLALLSRDPI